MSEFYINSKKNNIRWKKLDVSKIENFSQAKKDISNSPKENLKITDKNSISELKFKLQDEFSHILQFQKNTTKNIENEDINNNFENEDINNKDINNNFEIEKAKSDLLKIEKLVGLDNSPKSSIDKINNNSQDLLLVLNELRILSEKRLNITKNLNIIDNSLSKLQTKLLEKKKQYDKQVSDLKSMSSLYEQTSTLISRIISEDTNYEG